MIREAVVIPDEERKGDGSWIQCSLGGHSNGLGYFSKNSKKQLRD